MTLSTRESYISEITATWPRRRVKTVVYAADFNCNLNELFVRVTNRGADFDRRKFVKFVTMGAGDLADTSILNAKTGDRQSGTVDRAGPKLHYDVEGNGTPFFLLHDGLGQLGWFAALRAHLLKAKRKAILMDTRGMGRSSPGNNWFKMALRLVWSSLVSNVFAKK